MYINKKKRISDFDTKVPRLAYNALLNYAFFQLSITQKIIDAFLRHFLVMALSLLLPLQKYICPAISSITNTINIILHLYNKSFTI